MMTCTVKGLALVFMYGTIECQTPAPPNNYCSLAKPIYWHSSDTRKTKEQVDRENRKYKRLCPDGALTK